MLKLSMQALQVSILICGIGLLVSQNTVLAGKTVYGYEGPEDCRPETCDCFTAVSKVADRVGNIITKSIRTCTRKPQYNTDDYYEALSRVANSTKNVLFGAGQFVAETGSKIKNASYMTNVTNIREGAWNSFNAAFGKAKCFVGNSWNKFTNAISHYTSAIFIIGRWHSLNRVAKLNTGSKLFPPMSSQLSHFLANIEPLKPVIDGNDKFGYKLYQVLSASTIANNVLVSPLGVSFLMAMLQTGALGDTEDALRAIMNFPASELELAVGYRSISYWLDNANLWDKVTLRMVSGIFIDKKWEVNHMYNGTVEEYFKTNLRAVDYSQPEWSTQVVNDFVANATEDQVKDMIYPEFDGTEELVLVNAMYFNETWRTPFEKKNTRIMPFHISATYYVRTPIMNVKGNFLCGEIKELDSRAVVLPYTLTRFSMVIFLPYKRTNLAAMESKMESFPLSKLNERVTYHRINLFVPKFKMESEVNLNVPLKQLGLESIFEQDANLSAISFSERRNRSVSVSKVLQKITLEVNENGTMPVTINETPERLPSSVMQGVQGYSLFFVGHPFLAIIYDRELSTPVVMLAVKNPSMTITRMGRCLPSSAPECENGAKPMRASGPEEIVLLIFTLTFNWLYW